MSYQKRSLNDAKGHERKSKDVFSYVSNAVEDLEKALEALAAGH